MISRRTFISGGTAALIVAPLARAQQPGRPYRIGLLPDFSPSREFLVKLLVETLRGLGRIEGRDYVFYRSGVFYEGDAKLALERVLKANPDLILTYNLGYAIAARGATKTIPIVMWVSGFPVEGGVAESLTRPGGNVTGLTIYAGGEVFGKLVQLVHEAKPGVRRIGALMSYVPPFHPGAEADVIVRGMREAAAPLAVDLRIFEVSKPERVDDALRWVTAQAVEALVLTSDPALLRRRSDILRFALAKRLPTIADAPWKGVEPPPLLWYAASFEALTRQVAPYVNRILWEGAKPGELPIQLPAKFEFVVNLKTAKALGLTIPQSLLARADEVIQ